MARFCRAFALVFSALALGAAASAQTPTMQLPTTMPRVTSSGLGEGAEGLILEGALDASEYIVGPGDVFSVTIGGSISRQLAATVSADGRLVIPEAGTFDAAGRTLAVVRREAAAALQRQFRNVPTDVALALPRRFSVFVSGAIRQPGRTSVRAVARVEDALRAANPLPGSPGIQGATRPLDLSGYEALPSPDLEYRPAYRNVRVRHKDGTEDTVDLARFFATGNVRFNPYLLDGDAVHLPTFDPSGEGIYISGAVARRGVYDARPDDTVLALLTVASGEDALQTVRAVRVTRASGEGAANVTEVPIAEAATFRVQPRDQLFAIGAAPEAGTAVALGALRYPGTYPITSGATTLGDLVEMAGGLAPEALLRGAYLERTVRAQPQELRGELGDRVTALSTAPGLARFDSVSTGLGTLSDLSFVGRRTFQQETFRTPRLSLDIAAALRDGRSVPLRDGDRLVVPTDLGLVRVYGQVVQPGYVPFVAGQTAADYVASVGGLGPIAETVYVVDAATGVFAIGGPVLPGDAVYAARQPTADTPQLESLSFQERGFELQAERDRRQVRFQTISAVISTVGAITGIILTIEALRN